MIKSFEAVCGTRSRVLVLGSMPGVPSLKKQEYYANPSNAFWFILRSLYPDYDWTTWNTKKESLLASRIALWDVIASCERDGSLDSAIQKESIVVNDFEALYKRCPDIHAVFFNGARAELEYKKRVLPYLQNGKDIELVKMPSTSPAHAVLSKEVKLEQWQVLKSWS